MFESFFNDVCESVCDSIKSCRKNLLDPRTIILDFPKKNKTAYTIIPNHGIFCDKWVIVKQEKIHSIENSPETTYRQNNHNSDVHYQFITPRQSKNEKLLCTTLLEGISIRPARFIVNYGNIEKDITEKVNDNSQQFYVYYKTLFEGKNVF